MRCLAVSGAPHGSVGRTSRTKPPAVGTRHRSVAVFAACVTDRVRLVSRASHPGKFDGNLRALNIVDGRTGRFASGGRSLGPGLVTGHGCGILGIAQVLDVPPDGRIVR